MAEIENLEIRVGGAADGAIKAINRLISSMRRMQRAANSFTATNVVGEMNRIRTSADGAAQAMDEYAAAQQRANRAARGMRSSGAAKGFRDVSESAQQATNAIARVNASWEQFWERLRRQSRNQGFSKMSSPLRLTPQEPIETDFVDPKDGASKFESALMSLKSKLPSLVAALAKLRDSVGGGLLKAFKAGTGGITGFLRGLTRIAKFRIYRTIVKDLAQSFKDLYGWSRAFGTDFSGSVDTIYTALRYLRNSIAALATPLVNALAPVLDKIIDGIVVAINYVNQFFSALSGASTYTAAKKVAVTWESALESTSKKAKQTSDDIKRTILGFDEINKLTEQNQKTGGTSSGTSPYTEGYKEMFEERPIESKVKNIAETLRKTLGPVFDFIGDNLSTILKVAGAIGGALLAWKIGSKLSSGLGNTLTTIGKIKGALASVATAAITIALTYQFTNKYLQTGSYAYLVGNAITTALGGAITGLTMSRAFGAKAGFYSAAATIGISGLVDMVLGINDVDVNGLRKENITTLMLSVVKGAIAGALIAKGAGFSLVGGLTAGALTMGITIGLVATLKLIKFKPEIELTEEQKNILTEIEAGNFDNAMKLSGNDARTYQQVVASTEGGRHKEKNLLNKIEEIMGWVAYADEDPTYGLPKGVQSVSAINAKQKYAAKSPHTNRNAVKLSPLYGMSDTTIQKAKQFTSAIVSNMGTVKKTVTDTIDTSKTVLGGMATLIEQAAHDSQNVSWEPVGRNITQTLSKGETQSFPEAKAKFDQDMKALRNSGYTYSYDAVGKYIVSTLTTGIDTDKWKPINSVLNMVWSMFNKKDEVPWITFGEEIPNAVSDGVYDQEQWAVQAALDVGWAMYNAMNGVSFKGIGEGIIKDVYNGVVNNTKWVGDALSNIAKGLFNIMSGKSAILPTSTTVQRDTTVKRSTATKPTKSARAKALGGIFHNGVWSSIPQYAGGTLSAGSLFWAGENGPEIVGRAGSRTEVLNKSQLASAMYSAVQSAMAPAAANFAAAAGNMAEAGGVDQEALETILGLIQRDSDAMARQNDLLRQQNDYLRELNAKEWTTDYSTAQANRAQVRMNRRAGVSIVPIGT